MLPSPFSASRSRAGYGEIHLRLLPPNTPSFQALNFTYPLKLVCSTPHKLEPSDYPSSQDDKASIPANVPLVFMLSYGGGLLPPDSISLQITLEAGTRLTLTTQGSTKIFPSSSSTIPSISTNPRTSPATASQTLSATLQDHAALLLAPDPVQPFARSHYTQHQAFTLSPLASLCLLDWIIEGRRARAESWQAGHWSGKNELWREFPSGISENKKQEKTLMLRDTVLLDNGSDGPGQSSLKREAIGVFGTIILAGPLFQTLGECFVTEFAALPRVGGRRWGDEDDGLKEHDEQMKRLEDWRTQRTAREVQDRVLWTVAKVRGSVVVKFSAAELEGAKCWIESFWRWEGTVEKEFGEGGFMCFR